MIVFTDTEKNLLEILDSNKDKIDFDSSSLIISVFNIILKNNINIDEINISHMGIIFKSYLGLNIIEVEVYIEDGSILIKLIDEDGKPIYETCDTLDQFENICSKLQ